MNYYERHLGDYARDTGHLSPLEHGVYNLMLDRYYATESPIPADQAYRICRARSKDERDAVDAVLAEFFILADGVWSHSRAEREIEKFRESEPDREAKKENTRERQRRFRERRAAMFETLREHDIVPPFDASTAELEGMIKRVSSRDVTRDVTQPVTRDKTTTHTPDTRHQTPEEQEQPSPSAQALSTDKPTTDLLGVERTGPADMAAKRAQRLAVVTEDAIAAYNRILAKPAGLLRAVRAGIGVDTRREQVKRCLKTASEICQELYGDSRVTPGFWQAYFESASEDSFHSGRGPYSGEHENWRPDFDFLTRKKTMLKLFERAIEDDDLEDAA